jgi:hypothetical protein
MTRRAIATIPGCGIEVVRQRLQALGQGPAACANPSCVVGANGCTEHQPALVREQMKGRHHVTRTITDGQAAEVQEVAAPPAAAEAPPGAAVRAR